MQCPCGQNQALAPSGNYNVVLARDRQDIAFKRAFGPHLFTEPPIYGECSHRTDAMSVINVTTGDAFLVRASTAGTKLRSIPLCKTPEGRFERKSWSI